MNSKKTRFRSSALVIGVLVGCLALPVAAQDDQTGEQQFSVSSGGTLTLDLGAGGSVEVRGTGGSSISVSYKMSCSPQCDIRFDESSNGLRVSTVFTAGRSKQNSSIDLEIEVPERYDVVLNSKGGGLSIDGVSGTFSGKTMGGELKLHDVRGEAQLKTMGGAITLTDSELDGELKTMGGEVRFENVLGDVRGKSMGGDVRYKNVTRRDGGLASPIGSGKDQDALDDIFPDTVQISTMGGRIQVENAPEGADLHTMGGNIEVRDARRFVRAKTMGGDIEIDSVDGWVRAKTMGGNIDVTVTGAGGDIELTSMSGDIVLHVPSNFGMQLDLEIAFTRDSRKEYRIETRDNLESSVTDDWDYDHGSARKYVRAGGNVDGGGNTVKIRTVNGNIVVE
jgi:DUF4097 and DUF4098 domain-containing protein YvlB